MHFKMAKHCNLKWICCMIWRYINAQHFYIQGLLAMLCNVLNNFIPVALPPSMLQCPTIAVFVTDEEYANNYNGIMNNSCIAILTACNCHILWVWAWSNTRTGTRIPRVKASTWWTTWKVSRPYWLIVTARTTENIHNKQC